MKLRFLRLLLPAAIFCFLHTAVAQNGWNTAASLGNGGTPRYNACAMSIGNKGYIGTGFYNSNFYNDFYEYDGTANAWSQKAFLSGSKRSGATAFSVGTKGYLGLGYDGSSYKNDFWEYDPSTDTWAQKAAFAGAARSGAVGFSIGVKGYVGTGYTGTERKNDFWEYDPASNTWTQKTNFGGVGRSAAAGFSIGTKGYLGTGYDGSVRKNDFWEYDQATNTWTQKANFAGTARSNTASFAIGTKGYIGTGLDGGYKNDFWEYNPANNTWTAKANFGGAGRYNAVGFAIGTKAYIGTGFDEAIARYDFWEYDQTLNAWTQKTPLGGFARSGAISFTLNDKGYMGTGYDGNNYKNDLWEFNPISNTWTQKANCPGAARTGAVGFAVNSKGYLATGYNGAYLNDLWQYDANANAWTQMQDFAGVARSEAIAFAIDAKAYIGTGNSGSSKNDLWEYNPALNQWTQKANFPGGGRQEACGFAAGSKGYLATGTDNSENFYDDLWEYNPSTNTWLQLSDFPGGTRKAAAMVSLNNKGYFATGFDQQGFNRNDCWEFDPATGIWSRKADFAGTPRNSGIFFSTTDKAWIGFGDDGTILKNDLWKFLPGSTLTLPDSSFCAGTTFSIALASANYFNAGNTFTVLLSDQTGNFDAPTIIGSYSGTSNSIIQVTLPGTLSASTNYGIRVTASNPSQVLATVAPITIKTAPLIVACPSPVLVNTNLNLCTGTASFGPANATGYPIPTINYSQVSGSSFGTGITKVYTTAANVCGIDTCSFTITVLDKQLPSISCPSNIVKNTLPDLCSSNILNLGTPVTGDNCGVLSVTNNSPLTFPSGINYVTWQVADVNGNTNQCLQTVKVNDNQLPVLSGCPSNIITCSNPVSWSPPAASDNCGIASLVSNFQPGTNFPGGISTVTYTATDVSGNMATCSFTVNITSPVYTLSLSGPTVFCKPGSVILTVNPSGNSYEWYKNNSKINGATQNAYTAKVTGNYYCKVTSSCGSSNSNTVSVSALAKPTAKITPSGTVTICAGQSITLSANTGTGLTYQWKKGSSNLNGATNSTYAASVAGSYKVTVTTSDGCSKTSPATTVNITCKEAFAQTEVLDIKAFPNPSNGNFTLNITLNEKSGFVEIANLLGQVVYSKPVVGNHELQVDLQASPAGIYFIRLKSDDKSMVKKIEIMQ